MGVAEVNGSGCGVCNVWYCVELEWLGPVVGGERWAGRWNGKWQERMGVGVGV